MPADAGKVGIKLQLVATGKWYTDSAANPAFRNDFSDEIKSGPGLTESRAGFPAAFFGSFSETSESTTL